MRCKSCGAVNPDWMPNQSEDMFRFCSKCGAALATPREDASDAAREAAAAAKAAAAVSEAYAAVAGSRTAAPPAQTKRPSGGRAFSGDLAPAAKLEAAEPAPPAPGGDPGFAPASAAPSSGKGHSAVWIVAALVVLIGLAIGYAQYHVWKPATCTEPETCKICGQTRGKATGHDWVTTDCTEPSVCSVCGAEHEPFGHDWADATYEAPMTCRRCGATDGEVKGCIECGQPQGWSDETVALDGWNVHYYSYDRMISNCNLLTIRYGFRKDAEPNLYGDWSVYVRTSDGEWRRIGVISVGADSFVEHTNDMPGYTIEIIPGATFDAITVVPTWQGGQFSGRTLWISRAQTYRSYP